MYTHSDNIDKGGLARELQTDQCQLHLLLPEQALEPVQYPIDDGQHFVINCCPPFVSLVF